MNFLLPSLGSKPRAVRKQILAESEMMVNRFLKNVQHLCSLFFYVFSLRNNRMAGARNLYLAFGLMTVANERLKFGMELYHKHAKNCVGNIVYK
jgi:hypothetical protein